MANTPLRAIRIPDELWRAALERAGEREETVTDVVLRALTRYTAPPRKTAAKAGK